MNDQQRNGQRQNNSGGGGGGGGKNRWRRAQKQKPPADLWRPVPQLSDPVPIIPASDPTGLIRSLGDPPLQGQATVGGHYVAAVVERSAGLATALAAAAGLLADLDDGSEPDPLA
jgi:hypothetical protein